MGAVVKYMPSQLRPESGAHGVPRITNAPCPGKCGRDTFQVGGVCKECDASAPVMKYRSSVHSVTGRKWK